MTNTKKLSNFTMLFALIFAGEMKFSLPFHGARFFRPTLLETFSLSNVPLGDTFAIYGVTAMICYFPGGRGLAASLVSTLAIVLFDFWDPHVMHSVSAVLPDNSGEKAYRDILLIGYSYEPDLKKPIIN